MLPDSRKTRIFHVEMAFLFPSNTIVKIKYYITKDLFDLFHYRVAKEAYGLEVMMNTAIVTLSPHVHWNTRIKQIWEHTALQVRNDR